MAPCTVLPLLRNRRELSELLKLHDHHSIITHKSQLQGETRSQLKESQLKGPTRSQPKRTTRNRLKGGHQESVLFNLEDDTRCLTLQKVIPGGRGDTCSLQSHHQESAQGKNHASQLQRDMQPGVSCMQLFS